MRATTIALTTSGLVAIALMAGCTGPPKGIEPIKDFEVGRYMGRWYEIARLDHWFERGLTDVTATYTLRHDGRVTVVNRGWDPQKQQWSQATGIARSRSQPDVGSLEVSFFQPFWGGYHIIRLDDDYRHALVCGQTRDYLWILARSPALGEATVRKLVESARKRGFATADLIFVSHGRAGQLGNQANGSQNP